MTPRRVLTVTAMWLAALLVAAACGTSSNPNTTETNMLAPVKVTPPPNIDWSNPDSWQATSPTLDFSVPLSTKCGIHYLQTHGHTLVTEPLGDGRPPKGWPTLVAFGNLNAIAPNTVKFTSSYQPETIIFVITNTHPTPCP